MLCPAGARSHTERKINARRQFPRLRHDLARRRLDEFGVGFIEGGWPGAIPKDTEFFRRARTELQLRHATLAAFGSTRRPGAVTAETTVRPSARASAENRV